MEKGCLIWGKVDSHPWWPGMICDDPITHQYTKSNRNGSFYSIQFYSQPPSRGWVKERNIKEFKGAGVADCKKGGIFYSKKKNFKESLIEAEEIWSLTIQERLSQLIMTRGKIETERFGVGKKIPTVWQTAYVLMNTNDIPDGLTEGVRVKVPDSTKKSLHKKTLAKDKKSPVKDKKSPRKDKKTPVNDKKGPVKTAKRLREEDEMVSEEDEMISEEDQTESEIDQMESEEEADFFDSEEDISCSDEEDDWAPSKKKKKSEDFLKPKKTQPKWRPKTVKTIQKKKQTVSLTTYSPPVLVADEPKVDEQAKPNSTTVEPTSTTKSLVIKDQTTSSLEPCCGDFLILKAECKGGDVPFLWRYKKGGLLQKYEKKVENNQTVYQNILSYGDWWACYNHLYQRVETKIIFKYKNVEKVMLLEIAERPPQATQETQDTEGESEKSNETSTDKITEESIEMDVEKGDEKTQEQEVSSTTDDNPFQISKFIMDIKDESNTDDFAVWRVESQILLKKYTAIVKQAKLYHQPIKCYRGYNEEDIDKSYKPIKVKKAENIGNDFIEVIEEYKPKLVVDLSMEEEYDQHPLLRHFYVYLQVYLSQALEPGFVSEVQKAKVCFQSRLLQICYDSYVFPIGEIDKIINQKIINVERKCRWTNKIKTTMQKRPRMREVFRPDRKKTCEAIVESEEKVEENVWFFGPHYDPSTLERISDDGKCEDFRVGTVAFKNIKTYHTLCHFKYALYEKCVAKINMIKECKANADVTEVMDACLGNKAWVLQKFEGFMRLIEIGA